MLNCGSLEIFKVSTSNHFESVRSNIMGGNFAILTQNYPFLLAYRVNTDYQKYVY